MLPLGLNREMCALLDGAMLLRLKEDGLESSYSGAQLAQEPAHCMEAPAGSSVVLCLG